MDEFSGDQWYYDKDTNMIWATHNSSGIGDVNIATLTDINFDANNGRLIAAAPEMYELLKFFCEDKAIDEDRFDDYIVAIFEAKKLFKSIDGHIQEGD